MSVDRIGRSGGVRVTKGGPEMSHEECHVYVRLRGKVRTDYELSAPGDHGRTVPVDCLTLREGVGSNLGGSTKQNLGRIYRR